MLGRTVSIRPPSVIHQSPASPSAQTTDERPTLSAQLTAGYASGVESSAESRWHRPYKRRSPEQLGGIRDGTIGSTPRSDLCICFVHCVSALPTANLVSVLFSLKLLNKVSLFLVKPFGLFLSSRRDSFLVVRSLDLSPSPSAICLLSICSATCPVAYPFCSIRLSLFVTRFCSLSSPGFDFCVVCSLSLFRPISPIVWSSPRVSEPRLSYSTNRLLSLKRPEHSRHHEAPERTPSAWSQSSSLCYHRFFSEEGNLNCEIRGVKPASWLTS